ncbi:MAG: 1-acyl-sn-glycerol-3-phosphate acyltransferase, partial [Gemmatimonadales bacterium]|nr:1-acyl-sn-glycerol-3-phosphate acyltransferase [Gemmatimonadales bacterium]NIQ98582.1 1-acyl-sn-glycerol-3-phosphate acyltransferase [Gemmatimonadales bacterium]
VLVGVAWPEPICYLARRSLFRIRGLALLMRALGGHPISRGTVDVAGMRTALRLLRRGKTVLVFPEGTRTRDGSLGRFRSGAAALARRCGVPIVPA